MNNRQGGGRRRGRNNNNNNNGGRPQGNGRGGDSGNRIDSRARGNAAQLLEKYRNMARDAQLSGDRVMTEYYLQFADHYFRVLSDTRARQEEQRARYDGDRDGDDRESNAQEQTDEAEDIDELDAIDMIGRAPRRSRDGERNNGERGNGDRQREDRQREDRQRDGNRDQYRERNRDERPRDDRQRDDRPREDRPREDRPRAERDAEGFRGDRRPRREPRERFDARDDAPTTLDIAVLPPAIGLDSPREETPVASNDAEAPAPKKRGRPRKVVSESEGEAA